MKSNLLHF